MTPRDFFNQYVLPAQRAFEADPGALLHAVAALTQIDILAEQVWPLVGKPQCKKRKFREHLRQTCAELGYAWDVHDIHKHGMLTLRAPVLPNGRRPEVVYVGGAFDPNVFDPNVFDVGDPEVVLTLQDGSTVTALEVVKRGVEWWDQELSRLGWPC
jgi:hypothetical protein